MGLNGVLVTRVGCGDTTSVTFLLIRGLRGGGVEGWFARGGDVVASDRGWEFVDLDFCCGRGAGVDVDDVDVAADPAGVMGLCGGATTLFSFDLFAVGCSGCFFGG